MVAISMIGRVQAVMLKKYRQLQKLPKRCIGA